MVLKGQQYLKFIWIIYQRGIRKMSKNNSLLRAIKALKNVIKDLFAKMPVLFVFVVYVTKLMIDAYLSEGFSIVFLIGIMILSISIITYITTNDISSTTLSFILGILTVYSVNWGEANYKLFIILYMIYTILVFLVSSLKLAIKKESILTQAASKIDVHNFEEIYKILNKISMKSTQYNQLSIIDRCEIIRYLAFRQVITGEYEQAINSVELISGACQIELNKCCEMYYSMYMYCKNNGVTQRIDKEVERLLDKVTTLTITYSEFFDVFKETKRILIENNMNFNEYIIEIQLLSLKGYSYQDIISSLKERFSN